MDGDAPSSGPKARLYRFVFEEAAEAIVVLDGDGELLASNRAARELPGVRLGELFAPAREPRSRAGPLSSSDPDLAFLWAQIRMGGRGSAEVHVRESPRGPRVLALHGRSYGPTYVISIRDVTESRRSDDELRRLRHLYDTGHLMTSTMNELGNVLTAVVCATSVLEAGVREQDRAAAMARDIRAASERGTKLVRDALARMGTAPSKMLPLHLGDAVEETRSLLEIVVGPRIELCLEVDAAVGGTVADRMQLDHVLVNLAADARDAMPNGGKLSVVVANVPADDGGAATSPRGSYVSVSVTDTGAGMAPAERERVFERLYASKHAAPGSGQGVAAAYRFVKRSGGCIAVRTRPGQGTSIVMYLPRSAPVPRTTAPQTDIDRAAIQDGPRGREGVLLIEPDDAVRGAVSAVLREGGYRVIDAPNGEVALQQVELAAAVELVLADMSAPGPSAREIAARLGAAGRHVRLSWMSGEPDRRVAERRRGDEPLLRKAFTPLELLRHVREVLDAPQPAAAPKNSTGGD
jgi:signal transduction histidine kinase/CheY-like chemotaxis protein